MKKHPIAMATLVSALALAGLCGPALASTCLRVQHIKNTEAPDGKTLIVTMNNGKVWHNRLQGTCSELKFDGFVWVTHDDQVCDNLNTLHVIDSGQICQLGVFVPAGRSSKASRAPG